MTSVISLIHFTMSRANIHRQAGAPTVVRIIFAASLALISSIAHAADGPAQMPNGGSLDARNLAAYRSGVDTAKSLAKANNAAAAEQVLVALNLAPPNTAEWHIETAQRLIHVGERLIRDGQPAGRSAGLFSSALQHLSRADSATADSRVRATARRLAGFVNERFIGDAKSALDHYRESARLAPNSAAAVEAADRLQRTDDTFREKNAKTGR